MREEYKELIRNLNKNNNLNKIKHDKKDIHNIWVKPSTVGKHTNNFKNAIIISTNIAESSLTFETLNCF